MEPEFRPARLDDLLESVADGLGVAALHLEVGPENEKALGLYRRAGYEDRRHHLMTRRLHRSSPG